MTEPSEPLGLMGESHPYDDACLDSLWRGQLGVCAGSPAVIQADRTLTHDELAHAVRAQSAQLPEAEGALRAIVSPKGWEQVVAVLSVMASGGAYVPLELPLPAARVVDVLARVEADALITASASSRWATQFGPPVHVVAHYAGRGGSQCPWRGHSRTGADLAYVIFTSGSTGVPKGVMISHRAAANTVLEINHLFDVGPRDRTYMVSSLGFDLSVYDIFGPLVAGGAVTLPRPGADREPALWLRDLVENEVTIWNSVPALMKLLVEHVVSAGGALPRSLRLIMLSGDWVPPALTRAIRELAPWVEIAALGGATEASIWSVIHLVDEGDALRESVPYGHPLANQSAYVLDDDLLPVPVGVAGDLYLAGAGLAEGYLGDPELTDHAFRFHPVTEERLYRTGDRARLLDMGELEFLGRRDLQVKVHGYRIELGEVETALRSHPAVETATAVVLGGRWDDNRRLAAGVTLRRGETATESDLREHLSARVPRYMVPRTCAVLSDLPLTANGKVDREEMAARLAAAPLAQGGIDSPLTEIQATIAATWSEVLGTESVVPEANFFEHGGSSLQAIRVLARLRHALQRDIPARAIFEAPDLFALADLVAVAPPLLDEDSPGTDSPAPLTFQQEGVWFLDKLVEGNRAYNFQCSIRFKGALDVTLLEQALTHIVRRHEMLRTTIEPDDGGVPRQIVHGPFPVFLPAADLRGRDDETARAMIETLKREEFGVRFDFSQLPLIRWRLIQLRDDEFVLLQVEHHFVHDGWSLSLLWHEVESVYAALARGTAPELPPLEYQYAEYARRQRARGETQFDEGLSFWRETLDGAAPVIELPGARGRPPRQRFVGQVYRGHLEASLVEGARDLARATSSSLFGVCMSAFLALVDRYLDRRDLVVATTVANRLSEPDQKLIGMFVNTVPVRQSIDPESTFSNLVEDVRETFLSSLPHQSVPFDRIVRALALQPDLSRNPIVQVAFSFHDSPMASLKLPNVQGTLYVESNSSAKFDLSVIVIPGSGAAPAQILWEFNTDVYDEQTVAVFHEHYVSLLRAAVTDPDTALAALPLSSEADARVQSWPPAQSAAREASVVERFKRLARDHPDVLAIAAHDRSLSWSQLLAEANALAAELLARGIDRESIVGVYLRRGAHVPVAMLGVALAGGAHLLLDPDHPLERLNRISAIASPSVTITTRELADQLEPSSPRLVLEELPAPASAADVDTTVDPESAAYIVATSGSTGEPKLVVATHQGLANLVRWTAEAFAVRAGDHCAQLASLTFDAAVWETWGFLANGACLHIPHDDIRLDPEALTAWIAEMEIDVVFLSTPFAEATMDIAWPRHPRVVLTGGDKLRRKPGPTYPPLSNCYGPAECTVVASWLPSVPLEADSRPITIGRPIRNTAAFVLDDRGDIVPIGVPGELWLGGPGVTRGYLADAEASQARFRTVRVAGHEGRLYRTGDLARYLADGSLEFLGRADRQVKIRGVRIELGEVETSISEVGRCSALVVPFDGPGGIQLLAYLVAGETTVDVPALREDLRTRLPLEMIPASFTVLERFPLSSSGKIDLSSLPTPAVDAHGNGTGAAEEVSLSRAECELLDIWRGVLDREDIGIDDNFFDLGGHSLLAAKIVVIARQRLGLSLPVVALFETPTIRGVAAALEVYSAAGSQ